MSLNDLQLTVLQIGSLIGTVLFVVRACRSEIKKMWPRKKSRPRRPAESKP